MSPLPVHGFPATRVFIALTAASLFCFVVLFAGRLPVALTTPLFLLAFGASLALTLLIRLRRPRLDHDPVSAALIVVTLVILTIPRLTYAFDWLPGNTTLTHADDYARLVELLAMTGSATYPLSSPSNAAYPFSFYYLALYPFAVLKQVFPVLTLKNTIVLGNLVYHAIILSSIYEIARTVFRTRLQLRVFIFFVTVFGGLDWEVSALEFGDISGRTGPWQRAFHSNTQISSFYTGLFWTVHHFVSAYATFVAGILIYFSYARLKIMKFFFVLILLISAFYASPFAFFSVPVFMAATYRFFVRKRALVLGIPLALAAALPLGLFLGKLEDQGFVIGTFRMVVTDDPLIDRILTFPVFVLMTSLIELLAIPILLLLVWQDLNRIERRYLLIAWAFLISTYFIAYSGANNYAMRGMFVPCFVFFFLAARHAETLSRRVGFGARRSVRLLVYGSLVLGVLSTADEFVLRTWEAASKAEAVRRLVGAPPAPELAAPVYAIASDAAIRTVEFRAAAALLPRQHIYEYEKFIVGLDVSGMQRWERELLRRPFADAERSRGR